MYIIIKIVNTHAYTVLQSQLSSLICSDIHCVHNHPYIAVKIVLTSASTATSYVGMIVNNVAKYCVCHCKLLVLCTLSDNDTVLLFVDFALSVSTSPQFSDFYNVKKNFYMTFLFWSFKCYSSLPTH